MSGEIINFDQYRRSREISRESISGNNALRLDFDEIESEQSEQPKEKKYFYDIARQDIEIGENIENVVRAFIEEKPSDVLTERVNDSLPYLERRVDLDNWEYNKHAEAEKEATINIFKLGKAGCNLVVWISPDDGGDVYKEGRLNIEFPTFGTEEWSLYGKHMPLFWNKEESVDLAKRLLENGGVSLEEIYDSEDVRRQPIGFNVSNIDKWTKKCRELIPEFEEVWQFIENGGDLEQQDKVRKAVIESMAEAKGNNYYFESLMLEKGFGINAEGGHGSSYGGEAMGIVVSVNADGSISYQSGSTEGLTFCEKCGCYHSGERCPRCQRNSSQALAA